LKICLEESTRLERGVYIYIYIYRNRNSAILASALRIFVVESRQQDNMCRDRNRSRSWD
jgi:hypothetical protein